MKISIMGVGYVGIHSIVNLASSKKKYEVVGFDINKEKIKLFNSGIDVTDEVGNEQILGLIANENVKITSDVECINESDIFIVTVPTDASIDGTLNINPLISASKTISSVLKKGSIIIYESTVYPGLTDEVCIPLLEESGMKAGIDFDVVYTPERVDPGNKVNTVLNTPRVISGTREDAVDVVIAMYEEYIEKMVKVSTIKAAESVKILENTQRDINIALMNNFSMLMDKMDIDFDEVLTAASTKWNFLNFQPGMVGGHCIGVDPYYLIKKMKDEGVNPDFIQAARDINEDLLNLIEKKVLSDMPSNILYIGCTFKPNTNDVRNSKHLELIHRLEQKIKVDVYDPAADYDKTIDCNGVDLDKYDAVVVGVLHSSVDYSFLSDIKKDTKVFNLVKGKRFVDDQWNLA